MLKQSVHSAVSGMHIPVQGQHLCLEAQEGHAIAGRHTFAEQTFVPVLHSQMASPSQSAYPAMHPVLASTTPASTKMAHSQPGVPVAQSRQPGAHSQVAGPVVESHMAFGPQSILGRLQVPPEHMGMTQGSVESHGMLGSHTAPTHVPDEHESAPAQGSPPRPRVPQPAVPSEARTQIGSSQEPRPVAGQTIGA